MRAGSRAWGLLLLAAVLFARSTQAAPIRLHGQVSPAARTGQAVARLTATQTLPLAFTLPLRNQAGLQTLLRNLYDPKSSDYKQFLTSEEFTARFAPTQSDYEKVIAYARAQGFTVTATHPNRALLEVSGTAALAEKAFALRLMNYRAADGRQFYAPDAEPSVPAGLASVMTGVIGLDNAAVRRPQSRLRTDFAPSDATASALDSLALPLTYGTGPSGGFTPANIKTAYNLNTVTQTGSGQTLALFELSGYKASDITAYETYFSLPAVTLQNVLVGGATGAVNSDSSEVTLDIELQIALAPGATKIQVYEGLNTDAGTTATYNRIATDNTAKEISTSWDLAEKLISSSVRNAENTAFKQMAAQGQTIFAASGDSGADDNGSTLSVGDPASQPYMCGVGGTTLTTSRAGGPYVSETTWNQGSASNGASGGGISTVWAIPSYQSGVVTTASKGSMTNRNVPDVSLDSDPNSGYSIYYNGKWVVYGGTSCAAPLWSAFAALVNQKLAAAGSSLLGFINPALYTIAKGSSYTTAFHDIADGSTNLIYPAVTGYDDATGLGTFNGANLLAALSASTPTAVSLSPASAAAGSGALTLTVNGTGFVVGSLVNWNGAALTTTYVSSTVLTATVPASLLAAAGTVAVTVSTPSVGTSGALTFTITATSHVWTATGIAAGTGGIQLLWDNTNGAASLWTIASSGGIAYSPTYGPYAGWTAKAVADAPDGSQRLLWTNTDGTASVWTINGSAITYSPTFGPYTGWSAAGVTVSPDGLTHLLWTNTDGSASYWNIAASGTITYSPTFGPYTGWTAKSLSAGGDGGMRLLWTNTDGRAGVWTIAPSGTLNYGPTYGPFAGWTATAVGVGTDNVTHLLWDNTSGSASYWNITPTGTITYSPTYGPF